MMRPEIKNLCNAIIDEHKDFDFDDACDLCDHVLKHIGLCYFEYIAALEYIFIGLTCEQEGVLA
jgi:hypothetical protein